ncbi:MAG: hypothetical protein HOA38_04475 [Candidatus Marinimicrobia bacterium]|jgi:hypothetical protein|nr:hypothetical protein [Candidatus Neomarinimicrobiota bacterium]
MKFNLFGKISVIVVSLALLVGCGTAPVRNVDSAMIPGENSISTVEKAISRAGAGLGWVMTKKSDGNITGKLALRSHLAVIDITYDKSSYSIKYVDSTNLNYTGGEIHTNYNGWIENLQKAINIQLSIL